MARKKKKLKCYTHRVGRLGGNNLNRSEKYQRITWLCDVSFDNILIVTLLFLWCDCSQFWIILLGLAVHYIISTFFVKFLYKIKLKYEYLKETRTTDQQPFLVIKNISRIWLKKAAGFLVITGKQSQSQHRKREVSKQLLPVTLPSDMLRKHKAFFSWFTAGVREVLLNYQS